MNREKRVSKAPERLIEQIGNEKQSEKAPTVRKPKETKEPKKSLNLDLSRVPVSDDPKFQRNGENTVINFGRHISIPPMTILQKYTLLSVMHLMIFFQQISD